MTETVVQVTVQGVELEVNVEVLQRSGPWLVCLHGLQSNKGTFFELLSRPFFNDFSIVAVDLPGFGRSSSPEKFSYSVEDHAEACRRVLEELGVEEFHLIGHSLGGMIGTLLLSEQILSFVNLEGNLRFEDCGASKDIAEMSFPDFQEVYPSMRVATPDFVVYKTAVSIVEWSKSGKLLELFDRSEVDRLFVYGEKNEEKAEVLSRTKAEMVPSAGHFLLTDNFDDTARIIKEFLQD